MSERGNQVCEEGIVYGYVNENGNEADSGQQEGAGDSQWLAPDPHRFHSE